MLVLSRRQDEQIVVSVAGHEVSIRVLAVSGKNVRLGVDAPSDVAVHREEVWERIALERASEQTLPAAS